MIRPFLLPALMAGLSLFAIRQADAALQIYESFDYAPGTDLADLDGGTGFGTRAWASDPDLSWMTNGSLSYPGLATVGNAVATSPSIDFTGNTPIRRISSPLTGVNGQTTWSSFLLRIDSAEGVGTEDDLAWFQMRPSGAGMGVRVGIWADGGGQMVFGLSNTSGVKTLSNVTLSTGQTYLVVASILWSNAGDETVSLFVNPALGAEPLVPNLSYSLDFGVLAIERIGLQSSMHTPSTTIFDELKIGTSFADVISVAIPEPSLLALLGMGAVILLWNWRRSARPLA